MRPAKGTAAKLRRARKAAQARIVRAAKRAAKERDGYTCRCCNTQRVNLEAAHLRSAGMGGRASVSSKRSDYVTLCHKCHQGPRSVHSGHVEMVWYEGLGGDGYVQFVEHTSAGLGATRFTP